MKQYKTIIFDMGNVILEYVPDYFLTKFTDNESVANLLKEEIFYHPTWLQLDQGLVTEEEFFEEIKSRIPDTYHDLAYKVLHQWYHHFDENLEMLEIVKKLKQKGYQLVLCSNVAKTFYLYKDEKEAFRYFDEFVISADINIIKPHLGIFEHLLETYQLDAGDCYFIDDSLDNVRAAQTLGIDGYWYNGNVKLLEHVFKEKGIL